MSLTNHPRQARRDETSRIWELALLLFLVFGGITIGRSLRLTFLLQTIGIKSLPYLYILNAVFTVGVSLAFAGMVDRFKRHRVLSSTAFSLGILALLGRFYVGGEIFPIIFFLGVEVATVLLITQFWNLAAAFFPVREAKKTFPLLAAGGLIGAVLAGFGLKLGTERIHTENVLFLLGAMWLCAGGLALRVGEPARRSEEPAFPSSGGLVGSVTRPLSDLREGIRYAAGSRFFQYFFVATVSSIFITYLIEYEYNRVAALAFPDADRLTAFFGLIQGLAYFPALVINLFALGGVFEFFGVSLAYLFYPLGLLGFSGVMATTAGFFGTVATRVTNDIFLYTVNDGAGNLFLGSVPAEVRGKIRSLILGVGRPVALGLAGAFLIFGVAYLSDQLRLVGIFLITGLWLLLSAFPLRRSYLSLLSQNLARDDQELKLSALRSLKKINTPAGQDYLLELLSGRDHRASGFAMELALSTGSPRLLRRLTGLFGSENPPTRAGAIRAAVRLGNPDLLPGLKDFLADENPGVRREAARAYLAFRPPEIGEICSDRLKIEKEPRVRALLWEGLISSIGRAHSPNAPEKPDGESGPTPEKPFSPLIPDELKDEIKRMIRADDDEERLAALDLLEWIGIPGFEQEVLDFLLQSTNVTKVCSILQKGGPALVPQVLLWLEEGLPERVQGIFYRFLGELGNEKVLRVLRISLFEKSGVSRLELIEALKRWRARAGKNPLSPEEISTLLSDSIGRHNESLRKFTCFERGLPPEISFSLLSCWRTQISLEVETILALIGLLIEEPLAQKIKNSLSGGSEAERQSALEALEEVLPHSLRGAIIRILDPHPTDPRASVSEPRGEENICREELGSLIEKGDRFERAFAILAVPSFPDSSSGKWKDEIQKLASDPEPRVREAVEILNRSGKTREEKKMLTALEKIMFLQGVGIFQHLAMEDLEFLADIARDVRVKKGEILFHQNDPGDSLFLIVSGSVAVLREEEGKQKQIALLSERECVGEMAILAAETRTATVETRESTDFLIIRGVDFRDLIRMNPGIVYPIFRLLVGRLRAATK
ncbi:MAG: cyclic nucleotide-binding domain-containing protein [Proteobacteria bacterium]|nr:cyclic nucleotide-binding domain-containing protein [Pseudomonadota bacterium]